MIIQNFPYQKKNLFFSFDKLTLIHMAVTISKHIKKKEKILFSYFLFFLEENLSNELIFCNDMVLCFEKKKTKILIS